MLVKDLIKFDPKDATPIDETPRRPLFKLEVGTSLFEAIDYFQEGTQGHIAGVIRDRKLVGVVTLEDAIEELIQEEIVDETDVYEDVDKGLLRAQERASLFRRFSTQLSSGSNTGVAGSLGNSFGKGHSPMYKKGSVRSNTHHVSPIICSVGGGAHVSSRSMRCCNAFHFHADILIDTAICDAFNHCVGFLILQIRSHGSFAIQRAGSATSQGSLFRPSTGLIQQMDGDEDTPLLSPA